MHPGFGELTGHSQPTIVAPVQRVLLLKSVSLPSEEHGQLAHPQPERDSLFYGTSHRKPVLLPYVIGDADSAARELSASLFSSMF